MLIVDRLSRARIEVSRLERRQVSWSQAARAVPDEYAKTFRTASVLHHRAASVGDAVSAAGARCGEQRKFGRLDVVLTSIINDDERGALMPPPRPAKSAAAASQSVTSADTPGRGGSPRGNVGN